MTVHKVYMKRCLELASQGLGLTAPNPMVGAVIVFEDRIIGEGYHMQFGGPHAEVNAVQSVKDKSLLKRSTLYVNLEPCSHMGKTPPCSDMIISCRIPKVVIGTGDPNPKVNGNGMDRLKKAGVSVTLNILPEECERLNKRFFTFHHKKRPYVILKWAQTKDGFIDIKRNSETPVQPNWISNTYSKMLVHKWRSEEQAILIGTNTAIFDNPRLTVREWSGKNPLRIILDRNLRIPKDAHVFDGSVPTIILNDRHSFQNLNNSFIPFDFQNGIEGMLHELYQREIQSVLVEGGKELAESFIKENLWDEARVFTGDKRFYEGITAPRIEKKPEQTGVIQNDILSIYRNDR